MIGKLQQTFPLPGLSWEPNPAWGRDPKVGKQQISKSCILYDR